MKLKRRIADLEMLGSGNVQQDQQRFVAATPGAITRVADLVRRLEEKRADLTEPTIAPRVAFEGRTLPLNAAIGAAAQRLYLDGHLCAGGLGGPISTALRRIATQRPDVLEACAVEVAPLTVTHRGACK